MNPKRIRFSVHLLGILASLPLAMNTYADEQLTALEEKWLDASTPVLDFAAAQGLAVDVVVIPQSSADDVPLSMGVRDGRCKLMLSLRGNADAESTLNEVDPSRHALMIETMAAHEIAHCWRYTQGVWHRLPAGFVEATDQNGKAFSTRLAEMRATQVEEGFADLVALAWTRQHHPADYSDVHAWLMRVRAQQPLTGNYHDTRAWLKLVKDQSVFPADESCFQQVQALWAAGLRAD